MKRLVLYTTVVLTVAVIVLALWQMRDAVTVLLIALTIGTALDPLIQWVSRRRFLSRFAIPVVLGGTVVILGLLASAIATSIYSELTEVVQQWPAEYGNVRQQLLDQQNGWINRIGESLPAQDSVAGDIVGDEISEVGFVLFDTISGIASLSVLMVVAGAVSSYWLSNRSRTERLWLLLLPLRTRTIVRAVWRRIYDEVGIYVRGEALVIIVAFFLLAVTYTVLDLPGAVTLALLGSLAQVVPLLNIPLALIPAVIVGLGASSTTGLLAGVAGFVVLWLTNTLASRIFFRYSISVNPVLLVFLIMALAQVGGIVYVLLAPPLAVALQSGTNVLRTKQRERLDQAQANELQVLEARLDNIAESIDLDNENQARLRAMLSQARKLVGEVRTNDTVIKASEQQQRQGHLPGDLQQAELETLARSRA